MLDGPFHLPALKVAMVILLADKFGNDDKTTCSAMKTGNHHVQILPQVRISLHVSRSTNSREATC